MSKVHYFCPQCQGNEVIVNRSLIVGAPEGKAACPLCGWTGTPSDLLAGITPDDTSFWDAERVANALLAVASRYAAGPMVVTLEQIGLVPRIEGDVQEQDSARAVREGVMKAVLEAVVTSAFEAAQALSPPHYERFQPSLKESTARVFRYTEGPDDQS